jgi:FtsH-binding integral membrane protein
VWLWVWRWASAWLGAADGPEPEARSVLRKVYLYLVLGLAVTWTVWNAGRILHALLRTLLLGEHAAGGWAGVAHDLGEPVAAVLVFGACWLYHARVVGHEAGLVAEPARQAAIRWLYGYLASLIGAVTFAIGIGGTAATLLDLVVQPNALRPTNWAEERVSLFATLAAVGLPLWTARWGRLQREAATPLARASLVRRVYLLLAFALAVLTLLTSGVYALYQVTRAALGERWTAGQTTDLLAAASAAAVAGLLLLYHLRVFRRDAAAAEPAEAGPPVVAVALLRASNRDVLTAAHRRLTGVPGVEVELHRIDEATAARLRDQVAGTNARPP